MLILRMSSRRRPYWASNRSGKMASSKVLEHSNPIDSARRRATFPALRADMTAGTEA